MSETEIKEEFRSIISHALLGSDTSDVSRETWELMLDEVTKYTLKLKEGKLYTRSMNCNMGLCILALYKHGVKDFVKVEEFLLKHSYPRCGDFSYLCVYNLLEKRIGNREDGSRKNGYYKLTEKGILFAQNLISVPEKFMFQDGQFKGFVGKNITIKDALGIRFNYNQLLYGSSAKTDMEQKQINKNKEVNNYNQQTFHY